MVHARTQAGVGRERAEIGEVHDVDAQFLLKFPRGRTGAVLPRSTEATGDLPVPFPARVAEVTQQDDSSVGEQGKDGGSSGRGRGHDTDVRPQSAVREPYGVTDQAEVGVAIDDADVSDALGQPRRDGQPCHGVGCPVLVGAVEEDLESRAGGFTKSSGRCSRSAS